MIIGFIGKAGAGKSTAATYLKEKGWGRVNFKDGLVEEMKATMGPTLAALGRLYILLGAKWATELGSDVTDEELITTLFQEKPEVMRKFMQNYGTDLRRAESPDYWVRSMMSRCQKLGGDIAVDDVRFINEGEAIKKLGGILIRIKRENHDPLMTHVSETEQDAIVADYTIFATHGGQAKVFEVLEEIIKEENGKGNT